MSRIKDMLNRKACPELVEGTQRTQRNTSEDVILMMGTAQRRAPTIIINWLVLFFVSPDRSRGQALCLRGFKSLIGRLASRPYKIPLPPFIEGGT
jgi:hypothetical protein